ncbi:MAG: ABC transporter permease [Spirochaetae bacterium HGW-Spirochaetae-3]|nr:MAG: ABC transporter permease [Spirochaetae bacterium HGW-Spirochaetae-3]
MTRSRWTGFVAARWFRSGRDSGPSLAPSTAGIAVGVAALLCVIGVMNGFQMGFIDAVLDLDSYHVRVPSSSSTVEEVRALLPRATAVLPFVDVRTMASNERGKASSLRVKILPDDALTIDPGMAARMELRSGGFGGGIVIGSELSRHLDLRVGDVVSVLDVSADEEEGVSARMIELTVSGVYRCGYYDYDASLAFLPVSSAGDLAHGESPTIGVKLADRYDDERAMAELAAAGVGGVESWREYNRAFFGALRMEKSVMMMLVGLIFIVVGVNIFHSMRKAVYGRVEDIATMKALGADSASVRSVFMIDGVAAGIGGALIGLCVGLLVSFNINDVFSAVEAAVAFMYGALGGTGGGFEFFSPDLFYIGDVPVRLAFGETVFITASGAASAVVAARAASSRVSRILPSEVLRDE